MTTTNADQNVLIDQIEQDTGSGCTNDRGQYTMEVRLVEVRTELAELCDVCDDASEEDLVYWRGVMQDVHEARCEMAALPSQHRTQAQEWLEEHTAGDGEQLAATIRKAIGETDPTKQHARAGRSIKLKSTLASRGYLSPQHPGARLGPQGKATINYMVTDIPDGVGDAEVARLATQTAMCKHMDPERPMEERDAEPACWTYRFDELGPGRIARSEAGKRRAAEMQEMIRRANL